MTIRCLLACLLVGCGAVAPVHRELPAPAPSSDARMQVSVDVLVPWAPQMLDDDDALRVVVRGNRIEVTDDAIHRAGAVLVGNVVYAQEVADGWLFLSGDGSLLRSSSFVGELERVGDPIEGDVRIASPRSSRRLAILVSREGGPILMTSSGGAFAPIEGLGRAAETAAFIDRDHGVVQTVGGAVAITSDGGRSFRPLALDGPAARSFVDGERVVVELDPTDYRSDELGRLVAIAADGTVTALDEPPASVRGSVRRRPSAAADARAERLLEREHEQEPRTRMEWIDEVGPPELQRCELVRWNEGRLARCEERIRVARGENGPFADVTGLRCRSGADSNAVVDERGRFVALTCRVDDEGSEAARIAVIDADELSFHEIRVGEYERAVAVHEGAVVTVESGDLRESGCMFDADGDEIPLPAPREAIATFGVSGSTVSIVARDGARTHAWAGPIGAAPSPVALPDFARAFAMADAQNGIAAGEGPNELAVTRDGGASFDPVPLAIEGELVPPSPLRGPGTRIDLADAVECAPGRCSAVLARHRLAVTIEGFGRDVRAPTLFAAGPVAEGAPSHPERHHVGQTECSLDVDDPEDEEVPLPALRSDTVRGALGEVEVTVSRRTRRIEWTGREGRSAWTSRSMPMDLPEGHRLSVAFAERDLVVLALCAQTCTVLRARRDEAPEILERDVDGSILRMIGHANDEQLVVGLASSLGTVHGYWLDRSGALRARRTFAAEPVIAARDRDLVFVAVRDGRAFAIGPTLELVPPETDAPVRLRPCPAGASGPTWVVLGGSGHMSMPNGLYSEGDWRLTARRVAEGELCVERAEAVGARSVLVPRGDTLVGAFRIPGGGTHTMTCTLP